MNTKMLRKMTLGIAVVAVAGLWTTKADAAAFLWVSAPNWSYSAAYADSPAGFAYFWGLSVGPGTWSWAYAFSNGGGGSAYAFAEASANGLGGQGGAQVAGIADPYAGVGIDIPLTDPSTLATESTDPDTDPFSSAYTVTDSGITLTGNGEEMNGVDELQAFTFSGETTDDSTLKTDLGAPSDNGTSSAGDVSGIPTLMSDLSLIPLDDLITDPSSISSIPFTENDPPDLNLADVILVGEGDAESDVPEPASLSVLALGGLALLRPRKRRRSI